MRKMLRLTTARSSALTAVGALSASVLLGLGAPAAWAHDSVIGGNITDGQVVEEVPESIILEFSGKPGEGYNTLAITDKDSGEVIVSGEPTLDDRELKLDIPADKEFAPGEYQIGFSIVSSDGHATRGGFSFEVAGDATAATDGTSGASGDSAEESADLAAEDGAGPWPWLLGGAGLLVIIGVGAVVLGKRSMVDDIVDKEGLNPPRE